MKLEFAEPGTAASRYIASYFLFEDDSLIIEDSQRADCGQVRFFLKGKGSQKMPNGMTVESSTAMINGPHSVASRFSVIGPLRFCGWSLKPEAWTGLTKQSADTLRDSGSDGAGVIRGDLGALHASLASCASLAEMAPFMDRYVAAVAQPVSGEHVKIIESIARWLRENWFPRVEELYDQFPLSERQITRISNRYWGFAPKALARQYAALRTASAILGADGAIPEEALAHYADRPHLIREVKRVTGLTPGQIGSITNQILQITLQGAHFRELA